MRTVIWASLLSCTVISCLNAQTSTAEWCDWKDVRLISLAAAIAEYPIDQANIKPVIGIRRFVLISAISRAGHPVWTAALTDPKAKFGFYGLEMVYDRSDDAPPERIKILSAEVVFIAPGGLVFKVDRGSDQYRLYEGCERQRKQLGLSAAEFARRFYDDPESLQMAPLSR